jgi:hypothetical protein
MQIDDVVLFYSKTSDACRPSIELINKIYSVAKVKIRMVCLDSAAVRSAITRNTQFSIRGVPTLLISYRSGDIKIYEGHPKCIAVLDNLANKVMPPQRESKPNHMDVVPAKSIFGNYAPKGMKHAQPDTESENPNILTSSTGQSLRYKWAAEPKMHSETATYTPEFDEPAEEPVDDDQDDTPAKKLKKKKKKLKKKKSRKVESTTGGGGQDEVEDGEDEALEFIDEISEAPKREKPAPNMQDLRAQAQAQANAMNKAYGYELE